MEATTSSPAKPISVGTSLPAGPADTAFENFANLEKLITRAARIDLHPAGLSIPMTDLDTENVLMMIGHVLDAERDTLTLCDFLLGDCYTALCKSVPDGRKRGTWLMEWCCKRYGSELGPLTKARLMDRLAKAARLAQFWPASTRIPAVPLWLYQECRDSGLPFEQAQEWVDRWQHKEKVTRDAIRQAAEVNRTLNIHCGRESVIVVKEPDRKTKKRTQSSMTDSHLFNSVGGVPLDPDLSEEQFAVGLPRRIVRKLEVLAAAAHLSVTRYLENLISGLPDPERL